MDEESLKRIWEGKSDDELRKALSDLTDYDPEAQSIIQDEARSRSTIDVEAGRNGAAGGGPDGRTRITRTEYFAIGMKLLGIYFVVTGLGELIRAVLVLVRVSWILHLPTGASDGGFLGYSSQYLSVMSAVWPIFAGVWLINSGHKRLTSAPRGE